LALIAPVILPLQTPLQPQISASSERAATAAKGSAEAPPWPGWNIWPKISVSRIPDTSVAFFLRSLNQAPSAVSPYSTVPMILLSLRTMRL
jgi:hypothetical protein